MMNSNLFNWELDTCLFCDLLAGEPWVPFRTFFSYQEVPSELLFETENFGVITDIGPIVEGHCLIIAKEHIPSFACLSPVLFEELNHVKERLSNAIRKVYTDPIAFEHGAATFTKNAGCCIDHAHLHIVPINHDIITFIKDDFSFRPINSYFDTIAYAQKQGYLLYENQKGQKYLAEANSAPPQYFRRVLVNTLGNKVSWNWRDQVSYPGVFNTKEKLKRTREKLLHVLEKETDFS